MNKIEDFYSWFFLTRTCANMEISNCTKKLWVAPINKIKMYKTPEINYQYFAFAEKNTYWEIEYFNGLKDFLLIDKLNFPPIFIFDNHNHALPFWYSIAYKQKFKDLKLIHVDQHSDCWENKNHLKLNWEGDELEKVFNFCNKKCNVWNFIPPALESWIISNQIQIRSIATLHNLSLNIGSKFILDIDLDFCLNWIDRNKIDEEAVKILKEKFNEIWKYALWITIATSPYFINQELAINIMNDMFN